MNEKEIRYHVGEYENKTDRELIRIWKENNLLKHSPLVFEAIRRILLSRKIDLPPQIPFDKNRMEKALQAHFEEKATPEPFPFYMIGLCIFATWIIFAPFIKDFFIGPKSFVGDYGVEEIIHTGNKRVSWDFIVFFISAFFGVISGIQYLFSEKK